MGVDESRRYRRGRALRPLNHVILYVDMHIGHRSTMEERALSLYTGWTQACNVSSYKFCMEDDFGPQTISNVRQSGKPRGKCLIYSFVGWHIFYARQGGGAFTMKWIVSNLISNPNACVKNTIIATWKNGKLILSLAFLRLFRPIQ